MLRSLHPPLWGSTVDRPTRLRLYVCGPPQTCMPMSPHLKWPAYSCFAGATVCFKSIRKNAIEEPRLVPVKLNMRHTELESPGDIGFTAIATPLTMEQVRRHMRTRPPPPSVYVFPIVVVRAALLPRSGAAVPLDVCRHH